MPSASNPGARNGSAAAAAVDSHGLFPYDNDRDFVDRIASFLGPGTAEGEVGMAVIGDEKWTLLRDALGPAAERIHHRTRESIYQRPQTALAEYDAILRSALDEGAPAMRLVGEIPVKPGRHDCDAWRIYEAAINRAFAGRPVMMICGYDLREHPHASVEAAWETHPLVLTGGWEDNVRYRDPEVVVARAATTTRPVPDGLCELPLDGDAKAFAARLRTALLALRAPETQVEKLVRAAVEVFANAATHGRGARSQRIGRAGSLIVWELCDGGPGFDDPLAGYLPPQTGRTTGSGLWTVRQLTEHAEFLRTSDGFTARLWIEA